jgi:hypothetical protein
VRAGLSSGNVPKAPEDGIFVSGETPADLQPDRHPFLAQLDANVLEVWSNLLLILHQILRLQVHLIDTRGSRLFVTRRLSRGQKFFDSRLRLFLIVAFVSAGSVSRSR